MKCVEQRPIGELVPDNCFDDRAYEIRVFASGSRRARPAFSQLDQPVGSPIRSWARAADLAARTARFHVGVIWRMTSRDVMRREVRIATESRGGLLWPNTANLPSTRPVHPTSSDSEHAQRWRCGSVSRWGVPDQSGLESEPSSVDLAETRPDQCRPHSRSAIVAATGVAGGTPPSE